MKTILGRKHHTAQEDWLEVWNNIERYVSKQETESFVSDTANEIRRYCGGKRSAIAWSGGKDSIALQAICERAGVQLGILSVASKLTWPSYITWFKKFTPSYIKVYDHPDMDIDWLSTHQKKFLFPFPNANNYASVLQIRDQERYCREYGIDLLMTGRRTQDGNYCGKNGFYRKHGTFIFNPIRDYSHEQVIAVCRYLMPHIEMPPVYKYHDGFNHSAAVWSNWIKTPNKALGWKLVYDAEPDIVFKAAEAIPSAREFIETRNIN